MRRLLPFLILIPLTLPASAFGAKGFTYGVAAGEVTHNSAILWTRADNPGRLTLQVGTKKSLKSGLVAEKAVNAKRADDNTVSQRIGGLNSNKVYFYRFVGANKSEVGRFKTAPKRNANAKVHFTLSGDADGVKTLEGNPFYNNFEVYRRMAEAKGDFAINMGDTIYTDSEVEGTPIPAADSVAAKRGKYQLNLGYPNLRLLRRSSGVYSHWDDHEFINDFSIPENGADVYNAGVKAFREYMPVTYSKARGIYRTFRWGKNLELFFLDERSFRDAKASDGDTCDNPETGEPDLAPTAPQRIRNVFGVLVPSLKQPVSPACLALIRDENRDFLGQEQYKRFTSAIKKSNATFKVIVNEMPMQLYYALPYDNWSGYEAERLKLLRFLRDNVKNTIFLTTDVHANMVNDARLYNFPEEDPEAPVNSGILDVTTGPVATRTFSKQIDETADNENAGTLVRDAFLKPESPNGVGMACAAIDEYSYMDVLVNSRMLTVHLRNQKNKAVDHGGGQQCGPIILRKQ